MSNIIKNYQKNFINICNDFFKFWYEQSRFQYRPVVGYTLSEYKSEFFNINKEGFRAKNDFTELLKKNNKKIFFFGSSALVGIPNLSDEETLSSLTEKNLGKNFNCFNFGLVASKINSEFSLFQQIILENNPETVILYTGYNDLNAAYHGHRFEYYDDVNNLLKSGFEIEKNKDSIIYALDGLVDAVIYKFSKIYNNLTIKHSLTRMERAQKNRRELLKKKKIRSTYNLSKDIFINYLELFFYLCKKKKINLIYIHQPSLLSTDKELSEYEKEYFNSHKELGLYQNSDLKSDEIEFKKNYKIFKDHAHSICETMNIDYIDFEKILTNDYNKKNIFYDNVHLTKEGSEILSDLITSKIKHSILNEK